jgi:hypothetical protein
MMIVVVIIELGMTVVLMMPARIWNEPAIFAITTTDSQIISSRNNWKREQALIVQGWSLQWWPHLSGYQSMEHVRHLNELILERHIMGMLLLLEGIGSVLLLDDGVLTLHHGF